MHHPSSAAAQLTPAKIQPGCESAGCQHLNIARCDPIATAAAAASSGCKQPDLPLRTNDSSSSCTHILSQPSDSDSSCTHILSQPSDSDSSCTHILSQPLGGCQSWESDTLTDNTCAAAVLSHKANATASLSLDTDGAGVLSHVDAEGRANMVDVGGKHDTPRVALAVGTIHLGEIAFRLIQENSHKKGDVLAVAEVAAIMAVKSTANIIPLCHPLNITSINIKFSQNSTDLSLEAECEVSCFGKTGVEMEALTGVSVALLTVYDMCKAVTKNMLIGDIRLVKKTGGKSDYEQK